MASTIQTDSLQSLSAAASATDLYRYERKFHVTELDVAEIEMVVRRNPATFSKIYYPRWINNIYLDTWCRTSYADNLDGRDRNRVKSRIRWYGDLTGMIQHPVLEFKVRQGLVNRKLQFPLGPFEFQGGVRRQDLCDLFRHADMPKPLEQDLLKLEPALINRYQRKYFLSADGLYRLTVDSQQEFRRLGALG